MTAWIPEETPILESVFVDLADNADFIETIVFWDGDNCFADWVWCSTLTYRELEVLASDIANSADPARIWYAGENYWPWTS
jgi:hypothetical protein